MGTRVGRPRHQNVAFWIIHRRVAGPDLCKGGGDDIGHLACTVPNGGCLPTTRGTVSNRLLHGSLLRQRPEPAALRLIVREGTPPIVGRVEHGRLLLDLRCVPAGRDTDVVEAIRRCMS